MLHLKNSSASFVPFILRVLAEDLELFREHDFSFLVGCKEGQGGAHPRNGGFELLFSTAKSQNFISDFPKIGMSNLQAL